MKRKTFSITVDITSLFTNEDILVGRYGEKNELVETSQTTVQYLSFALGALRVLKNMLLPGELMIFFISTERRHTFLPTPKNGEMVCGFLLPVTI